MPKQDGNGNGKRLLRQATFGSFIWCSLATKYLILRPLACCARRGGDNCSPLLPPLTIPHLLKRQSTAMQSWWVANIAVSTAQLSSCRQLLILNATNYTHAFQYRAFLHKRKLFYCQPNFPYSTSKTQAILTTGYENWLRPSVATDRETVFSVVRTHTHTHTHTHIWRRAGTRTGKPMWILPKHETVSGSGISWAICKSAPRSRKITMSEPNHSVFLQPDALPAAQPTASKH